MRPLHTWKLLLPVLTLLLFAACGQEEETSVDIPISTESEEAREAFAEHAALTREVISMMNSPELTASREADLATLEGWIAAREGDHESAMMHADRAAELLAEITNPRKLEGYPCSNDEHIRAMSTLEKCSEKNTVRCLSSRRCELKQRTAVMD